MRTCCKLLGWIAFGMFITPSIFATGDGPASSSSASAPIEAKIWGCAEGFADILPGEYYACRAEYHLQRQHYRQAVEMLKDASHWANKDAQYSLGLLFFNGNTPDVPANRPLALAWLALAAERKNPEYVQTYAYVVKQSSPQEIQAAGLLWKKMVLEYGDKVAGLRALRRFNHEVEPLEEAANFGGIAYISGYSQFPETANHVVDKVHAIADRTFDGLRGTVTVGALQTK